jgi:cytochrome c-type biogenesis protein CcmH/NrfG
MEKFYENIEDYLSGHLSTADKEAFEKALSEQPELREALALYQEIEGTLAADAQHEQENAAVKETLSTISKDYFTAEKKEARVITLQRSQWIRRIAVAAAVILVIVFAWPYLKPVSVPQYADLADHPTASFTEMGGVETLLPQAEKAFNAGDYAAAIQPLQTYLLENDENTQAWFYLGISLLETGEHDQAETLFKQISTLDSAYKTEAVWYLALTALKKGELNNCKKYLQDIPEGSSHYEEAQQVLKRLD